MKALDLDSEKFNPTGGIGSQGILNTLGRPHLDSLTVMIREAVQNSWDARLSDRKSVEFNIDAWELTASQFVFLNSTIFKQTQPKSQLRNKLSKNRFALVISDRGTKGLGGPTRADIIEANVPEENFINFVRNIGQHQEQEHSGGTYGYGKSAFYRASEAHTICIYTSCRYKNELQSRFIAAQLGDNFIANNRRYTGRHWWGKRNGDIVDPVLYEEADQIAEEVGLRKFNQETGTSIMILAPAWGDERTPLQSMNVMIQSLLWYFWPKMIPNKRHQIPIRFSASLNNQTIEIPNHSETFPFKGFVNAMHNLKDNNSDIMGSIKDIKRYSTKIGTLSLLKYIPQQKDTIDTGEGWNPPIQDYCSHVALMRSPELVVKYLKGPPLPSTLMEYAGVFLVDPEYDHIFAKAEPPTHDDWSFENLNDKLEKSIVQVSERKTKKALEEFAIPKANVNEPNAPTPLGAFANMMGSLLPGEDGGGGTKPPTTNGESKLPSGTSGKPTKKRKPKSATKINNYSLIMYEQHPAAKISFEIAHAEESMGAIVSANANTILDGNQVEKDAPIGEFQPTVIKWVFPNGEEHNSDNCYIPAEQTGEFSVLIKIPHTEVEVALDIETKSQEATE